MFERYLFIWLGVVRLPVTASYARLPAPDRRWCLKWGVAWTLACALAGGLYAVARGPALAPFEPSDVSAMTGCVALPAAAAGMVGHALAGLLRQRHGRRVNVALTAALTLLGVLTPAIVRALG